MSLLFLNMDNFRNLSQMDLGFSDRCNIIYGQNGSGKTSIIEAIYYLILGRSFRSHLLGRIIRYGEKEFSLFGKIEQEHGLLNVGIAKSTTASKRIKVAGKNVSSSIEITKLLPLQLLNHDSYLLLHGGPKKRRQFVDWGLFHVEQSFLDLWRRTERALGQRNRAIRAKSPPDYIRAWDSELTKLSLQLHNYRKSYIEKFIPIAQEILKKLMGNLVFDLSYFAGWDTDLDLQTILADKLDGDLKSGYTRIGPHRADMTVSAINGVPAKDALSRGQQKLLLYGLQIAQGVLLKQLTNKRSIYLIDDLLAELDLQKCHLLADLLLSLPKTQIFITGLERDDLVNLFAIDRTTRSVLRIDQGVVKPEH